MQTQPIEFHPSVQDVANVLLPVPSAVFADRAARFATLAAGHRLGDWLGFLGKLTLAQHSAVLSLSHLPLPDAAALEQARAYGMPPLNASALPRPPAWRDVLRQLVHAVASAAPQTARPVLDRLLAADDTRLEELAGSLLTGDPSPADTAVLPFVAAALQVVFTTMASQLAVRDLKGVDAHGVCPTTCATCIVRCATRSGICHARSAQPATQTKAWRCASWKGRTVRCAPRHVTVVKAT